MPVFDTVNNLQFYVQNVTIPQIADVVQTELKNELNEQVEKTLYNDAYSGVDDDFYSHTFGLRNSAMSEIMNIGNNRVGKGLFIDIYLDPKSNYYSYYPEGLNTNVTDKIVGWLNDGFSGGRYKEFTINGKKRGFFESTYNNMIKSGKLKSIIKNNLRRLGYQLSR